MRNYMTRIAEIVFAMQHSHPISFSSVLGAKANNKAIEG
jgi:hypothetical protein